MGDVALAAPVIRAVDTPDCRMLILTRAPYAAFFSGLKNAEVFKADFSDRHKGLCGIVRLVRDINREYRIRHVIDLHSVIRTWIICLIYRLMGVKANRIDKGRNDKKKFIRDKRGPVLPHTTSRYADVFVRAGYKVDRPVIPSFDIAGEPMKEALGIIERYAPAGSLLIGIAPFAMHETKSWGSQGIKKLMQMINSGYNVFFFLFGGMNEINELNSLASGFNNFHIIAGKYGLQTELSIISRLRVMISMDSANMHLAALSGISTVSIWGGTHPATGFSPVGGQQHIIIQTPDHELDCRPCTIYGKGECIRKDIKYKCLRSITPETVFERMRYLLD